MSVDTDTDPDIRAMLAGLGEKPKADVTPSVDDDPDIVAMKRGLSAAPASSPTSSSAPSHKPRTATPARPRAPTQFQKSAAPTEDPELSWGETGKQALHNLVPSAVGAGKSMWDAIRHPIKTLETVGELGGGLASQAAGALGVHQDPEEKARAEQLARALEHHYATSYGSVKGFKKAVATDPVSVGMDVGSLFGGAGAGAKLAGLEKTAATLSKIDPIAAAVKTAATPIKAVARAASSTATGVPAPLMKIAAQAGSTTDPALRSAFLKFYSGQGNPADFLQTAQSALGKVRQDASDAYLAKKATLINATPSFQPVEDAIQAARMETQKGGVNVGQFKEANKALDELQDMVNGWKAAPDPAYQSLLGFDNLKQAIWDLRDSTGNSVAQKHLGSVYNGAKKAITDVDPEYAKLMDQYQTARANLNDTQRTLIGAGSSPAATLAMSKSLRALKTPTGKNLFSQLSEKEPTLPYMMAGNALHPWGAGGKAGLFEGAALPFAGLTGFLSHSPVAGATQYVGQIAAQSPKIAGAVNYGAGKVGKLAPMARGAYYAGRAEEENDNPVTATHDSSAAFEASPEDIDAATRMVMGEAGNQGDAGQAAVIHTALNRARASGRKLSDIVHQPWAFEAVTSGRTKKIDPNSADYKRIRDTIVLPALSGELGDPTGGSDHFLNRDLQLKKGRKIPTWAKGEGQKIGEHTFYRAGFASGGSTKLGHAQLVERLMKLAKAAKKGENKTTEPFLKVPDEHVAKALEIAQQAI